jgi:predicted RecA/RadA family phage recombinase
MKNMKTIASFGLLMLGLIFAAVLIAAIMTEPAGLAVIIAILGLMLLSPRAVRLLLNETGAAGVAADVIGHLRTLKYTHTAALTAGDILLVGSWVLQAVNNSGANAENVFIYRGKMMWPKEASLAITGRDQVYWDNTNGVVTKTAIGNTPIGVCVENALAADTTVTFMLSPQANIVTQAAMKAKAEVALTDAAATLTAAQLINSGIFKITPSTGRALTLDTAANLVAGLPGAAVGIWFDFSVVCLAAFAATISTASGLTLVGNMAVNNQSGTFRAVFTNVGSGTEAVTIYRIA